MFDQRLRVAAKEKPVKRCVVGDRLSEVADERCVRLGLRRDDVEEDDRFHEFFV